ncbi:MAG TPA: CPBP family intramembrane glutamic endopeptidase [Gammaproteobacteria bacterium]|nr:CPBP family intramembrane glutamic endopeptidase [Gammaproteobacteria bacterium]
MQITEATPSPARRFKGWDALWLILGFIVAQFVGSVLVGLVWGMGIGFQAALHGGPVPAALKPGLQVLAWSVVLGTALAAAWAVMFTWRYAKPLLTQAEATGIAWRAPSWRGSYALAVLLAVLLVALVVVVEYLLPPDPARLTGPMDQLSRAQGLPYGLFVLVAVALAPPIEEFVFRGAAFAALARSFGTLTAVAVTTLVFVALHTADKIHYWPGFLLVGCLALCAVFLRLRYRSLWPGILLHCCYNGLLVVLSR